MLWKCSNQESLWRVLCVSTGALERDTSLREEPCVASVTSAVHATKGIWNAHCALLLQNPLGTRQPLPRTLQVGAREETCTTKGEQVVCVESDKGSCVTQQTALLARQKINSPNSVKQCEVIPSKFYKLHFFMSSQAHILQIHSYLDIHRLD